jgi:hypothetical protein
MGQQVQLGQQAPQRHLMGQQVQQAQVQQEQVQQEQQAPQRHLMGQQVQQGQHPLA